MPTATNARGYTNAKYDAQLAPFGVSLIHFGNNPQCLAYSPCDAATDAEVTAFPDVRRLPDNLDTNPNTAQSNAIKTFLENNNIPAGWVNTSLTWRTITRGVVSIFLFVQRYKSFDGPPIFTSGVSVDTTFSALPQPVRTALQQAAIDQDFDTSSLTGASTLRQIFRAMGLQWGSAPIKIHGLFI